MRELNFKHNACKLYMHAAHAAALIQDSPTWVILSGISCVLYVYATTMNQYSSTWAIVFGMSCWTGGFLCRPKSYLCGGCRIGGLPHHCQCRHLLFAIAGSGASTHHRDCQVHTLP